MSHGRKKLDNTTMIILCLYNFLPAPVPWPCAHIRLVVAAMVCVFSASFIHKSEAYLVVSLSVHSYLVYQLQKITPFLMLSNTLYAFEMQYQTPCHLSAM